MGVIRTGVLIAVIGMMSFLREKTCRWESRWPKMNPGGGPHEKSTTGNGAEPQRGCTDQRTGCRLGLERTGLGIDWRGKSRLRRESFTRDLRGKRPSFVREMRKKEQDGQMKGLYFFASFSKIKETYSSRS